MLLTYPSNNTKPLQGEVVAVTGYGVISCVGNTPKAFFEGLFHEAPSDFPRRVHDFDPSRYFDSKDARRTDRFSQFAVAASTEALKMSGLLSEDGNILTESTSDRLGVLIGTGVGGLITLEEQILINSAKGERRVSPFLVPMMMSNAASANVSMRFGFQGPCETATTACAAGTHAIGNAARWISTRRCDVVIAGGSESSLTSTAMAAFSNMTALSTSKFSRPFDKDRDGFVMAEGAAILILESLEHALSRGAEIHAIISGAASTADANHMTAPDPTGSGATECMKHAIMDASLELSDIGHINAHGTSTPLNDRAEANAISSLFQESPSLPVTSIKGVTGHALGAAGALEALACILTLKNKVIPPTIGLANVDPEVKLNIVTSNDFKYEPKPILSNSFGFGGHNGCLVVSPYLD